MADRGHSMNTGRSNVRPFAADLRIVRNSGAEPGLRIPAGLDSAAILDFHGEVDGFAQPLLQEEFNQALARHPCCIILNFADVDYINSTGIALIVGVMAQARKHRVPLAACRLSEHYAEIFRITQLSDFIVVASDELDALEKCREGV